MKSTSIEFQQTKLTWFTEGGGFPLVFLHGFCEDHTVWDEFVKPFIDNYRVILPDMPGFGTSLLPEGDAKYRVSTSMEFYADCVKAILDEEKIMQCAIIGHSMGGYATLNFASRFSGLLKGFGLFHSSAYPDDESKKKDRERVAAFVRKNGAATFVNELYNSLFGSSYVAAYPLKVEEWKSYAAEISSVEGIAEASLAMRGREDTTDVLKNARVPVLFIIGKEDKAVNPEKTLTLTHLPETSVIHILPQVGHMGMFEAKEKCQAAVQEWLELVY